MWQERYADPGYDKHVSTTCSPIEIALFISIKIAIAKSLGLLTLRMADSIVLPLNTTQYAQELVGYLNM